MELTRRDALTAVGLTAVSATLAAREAGAQQMAGALPIRKPAARFYWRRPRAVARSLTSSSHRRPGEAHDQRSRQHEKQSDTQGSETC